MEKILEILKDNKAFLKLLSHQGHIIINENHDEAYLLAASFFKEKKTYIVLKNNQYQALKLYRELKQLVNDVCLFSSDESLRIEALAYSTEMLSERVNALSMLTSKPCICICHTHALLRYVTSPKLFKDSIISLKVNQKVDPYELRKQCLKLGYHQENYVNIPFQFSKRGGVIDIYSMQYDHPLRIEFFDDEIESISFFDEQTQKRISNIKEVSILPATDMLYDNKEITEVTDKIYKKLHQTHLKNVEREELIQNIEMDIESLKAQNYAPRDYQYFHLFENVGTLLDYPHDVFIVSNRDRIHSSYKQYKEESFFYHKELIDAGSMLEGLEIIHSLENLIDKANVYFDTFKQKETDVEFFSESIQMSLINQKNFLNQLQDYARYSKVLICLKEKSQINHLSQLLEEHHIYFTLVGLKDKIYEGINIYLGQLPFGLNFVSEQIVLLTSQELFKSETTTKKYVKYKNAISLSNYNELNIGDYVVHDTHGIGQYMGIKTIEVSGLKKDFLYIAYKGNDILYVPVENFKLIRKYASRDGHAPKVHALNSTTWAKEKARVRQKVDGLADELIALYSERLKQPGFAFKEDDENQTQFEAEFGYELTQDQQKAVDEIKEDMMKPRPMDRLLCGDVGFGKTEVALRAMMKAILSNKQCAFLCPTTILSNQHYHTMLKRFENFPVEIALINRFTTSKKRREIIQGLKEGSIDIVVGTHRILSKDIEFKDLGLLCIDEEQRFGVRQKEKIKEYRKTIDVLVLSATPIPRTLQMSLMGVRGLSQIETPPQNRLPVQTYVVEQSEPLVKQVIERELSRNGQVFYVHNRTEDIYEVASKLKRMIPDARVGVGHGQMKKEELEDVMNEFINHHYDILVSTTIIETGIDIPNANTIIVEDADRFGLAQLYQIKGRVGRSYRLAYAYLLCRKNKQMNEEATKRLKAIKEFTQLGSGYKIAMRDLSIRGSGDILGGEQAGFIDTIGFDMYMRILREAIQEKQGTQKQEEEVPIKNIKMEGYIPSQYVESDYEKLELYQKIYNANKMKELNIVEKELIDFYGKLPREVDNIVAKRRFEILSTNKRLKEVQDNGKGLILHFTRDFSQKIAGDKLFLIANKYLDKSKFHYQNFEITIEVPIHPEYIQKTTRFLQDVFK